MRLRPDYGPDAETARKVRPRPKGRFRLAEARKNNYLKGAAILAITVAITKVIGAIYKIPLYNILGDEGTTHFQFTYTIYSLLLTFSTAGVPVAMSRLIAEAIATNRFNQVRRYYKVSLVTFAAIGVIGMLAMLLFAQQLANFMGDYEIANGVRVLAPAVLFACLVCIFRGYSQGHGNMLPTAISQVMEVVCKLVFGLCIAWYFARAGYGSADVSAGAIVGVTIGLGLAVPILAGEKRRSDRKNYGGRRFSDKPSTVSATFREIMRISIPITLGSAVLNIITMIDNKLVLARLQTGAGFSYTEAKILTGVYSKALTLFNMPSALITPIAVSIVPFISAAVAKRDFGESKRLTESAMKVTNLLALPMGAGLTVLSYSIFQTLYPGSNENGPALLAMLGIASFFVCTYLVTNSILQASGYENLALLALPIGGVIKIIVNWFLVGTERINILGAPLGTLVCYVAITVLNVVFIMVKAKDKPNIAATVARPFICTVVMGAAAWAVYGLLNRILGSGRMMIAVAMCAAILAAVVVYAVLVVAMKAVTREDMQLVPKGEKIANLLHMK